MIISISLTYADINAMTPIMMNRRVKKRHKPNRKLPPVSERLKVLRRKRSAVRAKIKSRLNAITFRLGDVKQLPKKRSEMSILKVEYDNLERQIASIEKMRKRSAQARRETAKKEKAK